MTIRVWEFALLVLGGLYALLFFVAGSPLLGVGVAAAVTVMAAARLRPLGRPGVAGGHARQHAWLTAVQTLGIIGVLVVSIVVMLIASRGGWSSDSRGMVAMLALSGLIVMLLVELERKGDELIDWLVGAQAEEAVRDELDRLRQFGWAVCHNVEKDYGGNVDHVAVGETGVFAIETKSGSYRATAGTQAIGSAMAVRAKTGVSWVTAVVCVPSEVDPHQRGPVWVVSRAHLSQWLVDCREHRGKPINVADVVRRLKLG
jgi:hypothetical protein